MPTMTGMVIAWLEAARFAREAQAKTGMAALPAGLTREERLLANRLWKAEAFRFEEKACVAQRVLCEEALDERLASYQFEPVPNAPLREVAEVLSDSLAPLRTATRAEYISNLADALRRRKLS